MFNFTKDMSALAINSSTTDLQDNMPQWGVLIGSGWVLVYSG
jgi:hypothetical protein